ncbi:hypothetical protein D9V86_04575 [Bacteroidetes/Chlorobi group bacterium ChocPot_Mid]|jgi:membrane associated rhomboid family serine protease|nr:MAG: hypothetical protein D9V86_04575 [Bacteroidetes/Chlorobi group bacterium ChocPot_Mid]
MRKKNRIYYFSYLVILIFGIFYLVDLVVGGKLGFLLSLTPNLVYQKSEVWRLLTYPLSFNTVEGILISIFIFLVLAPKLEKIYHGFLYPIILLSIIFLQGILFAIFSWNSFYPLKGLEGISIFIITLFTLLNIRGKLIFFNKFYINTPIFSLGLVISWILTTFVHSLLLENFNIIFSSIFSLIFGVSAGMFAYLHIRYTKIINPKYILSTLQTQKAKELRTKLLSLAVIANEELKKVNQELLQNNFHHSHYYPNAEKLNEILDKIYQKGFNSLSNEEKDFLDEYSKTN